MLLWVRGASKEVSGILAFPGVSGEFRRGFREIQADLGRFKGSFQQVLRKVSMRFKSFWDVRGYFKGLSRQF